MHKSNFCNEKFEQLVLSYANSVPIQKVVCCIFIQMKLCSSFGTEQNFVD